MAAIAERVGPVGAVIAVDVSALMIAVARCRAEKLANAVVVRADAAACPFAAASFDALVSRLEAMFFDDPVSAFARLRGAVAGNGRGALAIWHRRRETPGPWSRFWPRVHASTCRRGRTRKRPLSFADRGRLQGSRARAACRCPSAAALPRLVAVEVGPLAGPLAGTAGEGRRRAVAAVRDVLAANGDGVVRLDGACWIVTARTPLSGRAPLLRPGIPRLSAVLAGSSTRRLAPASLTAPVRRPTLSE